MIKRLVQLNPRVNVFNSSHKKLCSICILGQPDKIRSRIDRLATIKIEKKGEFRMKSV